MISAAAGNELDDGAQHVGGRALDVLHVDGVDAEHDGEHAKAGNDVGFVGEPVERIADAETLHAGRVDTLADGEGAAARNCGCSLIGLALVAIACGQRTRPASPAQCAAAG